MLEKRLEGEKYKELSEQYGINEGALRVRVFGLRCVVREKALKTLKGIDLAPWKASF